MGTSVQHAVILPPPRPCMNPDMEAQAVGRARRHVRDVLDAAGLGGTDASALAVLLTSELATNALTHTGGFWGPTVSVDDRSIVITVSDGDPYRLPKITTLPADPIEALLQEHGRGVRMFLTEAVDWGYSIYPKRNLKEVWVMVGL